MNESKPVNISPSSSQIKSTAFVLDDDSNRKRRADRIAALKELGLKVSPARKLEGALKRCLSKSFDLVVVYAGRGITTGVNFCEELLAARPHQKVLLVHDESNPVRLAYSILDDLDLFRQRVQQLLAGEMSELLLVAV
jgi:DNA-binding NtrC family response regulator